MGKIFCIFLVLLALVLTLMGAGYTFAQYQQTKQQLAETQKSLEQSTTANEQLMSAKTDLDNALAASLAKNAQPVQDYAALLASYLQLQDYTASVEADASQSKQDFDALQFNYVQLQYAKSGLETETTRKEEALTALRASYDALQNVIGQQGLDLQQQRNEILGLKDDIRKSNIQIATLAFQVDEDQTQITACQVQQAAVSTAEQSMLPQAAIPTRYYPPALAWVYSTLGFLLIAGVEMVRVSRKEVLYLWNRTGKEVNHKPNTN